MNRRYNIAEFDEVVNILRKNYPNVSLTTDIIVGFPGETDEEFEKTYNYLKKVKFYKMHIFKYSPRKGTKAAEMENQIDGKTKEERSKKLTTMSDENEINYNKNYIGKEVKVLFEEEYTKNEEKYIKGHTTNYIMVVCKIENDNIDYTNRIKKAKVVSTRSVELIGKIIN